MSEHIALELTAEQASRIIAADIRAYPQNGPNKREEHLRLFDGLLSRKDIEGAWADRYAEIALAGKAKLARLGSRLGALRPKIEEVRNDPNLGALFKRSAEVEAKVGAEVEAKPPAPAYRRYDALAKMAVSFILPPAQPTAEP